MLTVASLVTLASLEREESRGTHFRTDHGQRDDANWCRHVFLERAEDGSIETTRGPIFPPTDQP